MKKNRQAALGELTGSMPLPEIAGVEHSFVNVQGLQLHVAEAGQGEPLILLHGWPQHWYMWRYLIAPLAAHYRVLCPDLRGFGWSDAPRNGYEKEQLMTDLVALLDTLGLQHVRLIGHDWGGWVGFLLCLHHPERVQQFLALNIPHPWQRLDWPVFSTLWRFWYQWVIAFPGLGEWLLKHQPGFVSEIILRRGLVNKHALYDKDLAIYAQRLQEPDRARASVQLYRTFLLREFFPVALGHYQTFRLCVPTRVLYGKRDIFVSYKLLRGYQPHTDTMMVELVPECGHFITEDCPTLVLERALAFFTS